MSVLLSMQVISYKTDGRNNKLAGIKLFKSLQEREISAGVELTYVCLKAQYYDCPKIILTLP